MNICPDEILSEKIILAFEGKLIPEKIFEKYKKKIIRGEMTREDWILITDIKEEVGLPENAEKN